ncbi:MAG: SDR family oxidoreductase [Candidatus Ancillula sp.]|jgi:gluconate 5-dehydrogenase|nr:SDR family oxidoreductase [Candidatus Ancillula sp.]
MSNLFNIKGKVAVVTGASSGLGAQFAEALAREGASVAILARRQDRLDELAAKLRQEFNIEVLPLKCDVTATADIQSAVAAIVDKFGRIDILVNNAGVAKGIPAEAQTDDDWCQVVDVNLTAVYKVAREVGKVMIKQNYGKIINTGSIHSSVAMNNSPISSYVATKHAVVGLTKELATEWAKYNITVNGIGPAYFESEMTDRFINDPGFQQQIKAYCPMGRVGRPGELDGALIYFASDASSYTTGQLLTVDGGWIAI